MSHNPLNEECKYGKQVCVNPPGIPCACPVCTCVPKQDDHIVQVDKMVKHGIYQEAWEDAITPLLQRTWDNNAGYYDWVDFIRQLLAEARKEERKRILEACGKQVEEESAIYGTDKHGLNLNDLTEIIYPDK
jgi:hypothetical protein